MFKIPKWPKKTATKKGDDPNVEKEAFQTIEREKKLFPPGRYVTEAMKKAVFEISCDLYMISCPIIVLRCI
ncbi:MAG: hypothetical protein WA323_23540 [Candidatus Nitrosopolaris sp.]